MSKLSFQYGFSVFLITLVVRVCSPLMVATANGSGKPVDGVSGVSKLVGELGHTEYITLVQAICGDDCNLSAGILLFSMCVDCRRRTGDAQVGPGAVHGGQLSIVSASRGRWGAARRARAQTES